MRAKSAPKSARTSHGHCSALHCYALLPKPTLRALERCMTCACGDLPCDRPNRSSRLFLPVSVLSTSAEHEHEARASGCDSGERCLLSAAHMLDAALCTYLISIGLYT